MKKVAASLSVIVALVASALPAGARNIVPVESSKSAMFYAVVPHPDDETAGWSMILDHSEDYVVMVALTQGEGTIFCRRPEESSKVQRYAVDVEDNTTLAEGFGLGGNYRSGPYGYQGPDSQVDEPNLNERHPLGDPWQGQGTNECKRARIASWHWFLDEMHALDGSTTSMAVDSDPWLDDDYRGLFCPPGHNGIGAGRPIEKQIGCADVWANDQGARVAFDLGNGHPDWIFDDRAQRWKDPEGNLSLFPAAAYGVEEVVAALSTVRESRAEWGIPALPETGMLVAADAYSGEDATCFPDPHPDHRVAQEALRFTDLGAGPQYGVARCPQHPFTEGADTVTLPADWATTVQANLINPVTEERLGPGVRNYGWVLATYLFGKSSDFYWKVFD